MVFVRIFDHDWHTLAVYQQLTFVQLAAGVHIDLASLLPVFVDYDNVDV